MVVLMRCEKEEGTSPSPSEEEDDWSIDKNKADRVARWVESELEWQKTRATSAQLKQPYQLPPPLLRYNTSIVDTKIVKVQETYDIKNMNSPRNVGLRSDKSVSKVNRHKKVSEFSSKIPNMPSIAKSQRTSSNILISHAKSEDQIKKCRVQSGIFFGNCSDYESGDEFSCDYDDALITQRTKMSKSTTVTYSEVNAKRQKSRIPIRTGSKLRLDSAIKPLVRFRRITTFVRLAIRWKSWCRSYELTQEESILFFMDIPSMIIPKQPTPEGDRIFDLTSFKSVKERAIATAARKVLDQPHGVRTVQQVNTLSHTLQVFSKFSGYPQHIQKNLCDRGWYAKFEPSRVLVRQGQKAEVFYFLLSGVAISRSIAEEEDPHESRRRQQATVLRKGDTIGEREVLQGGKREATIVSKEQVEVLGVDKEDFVEIFKTAMGDSLDCLPFLRTIEELRLFPLELLQTHTFSCCIHNYKRGSVIVKNSNESEWIIVVKSGSCRVVKTVRIGTDTDGGDNKSVKLPQLVMPESCDSNSDLQISKSMFPSINGTKDKKPKKQEKSEGLTARRRSLSDSQLPVIHLDKGLVNQTHERSFPTSNSDDELLKQKSKKKKTPKPLSKISQTGHFAQIDTLTERCVFGLQSIIYEDTPSLTLISNGAECIQVSKQFLREYFSPSISLELRKQVAPYPDSDGLQISLDKHVEWTAYKQQVVRESRH